MYIASADLMTRNQERRVGVGGPVLSDELKQFLADYLDRLLSDNQRAWREMNDGSYTRVKQENGAPANNIHTYYIELPIEFTPTLQPRITLRDRSVNLLSRRQKG